MLASELRRLCQINSFYIAGTDEDGRPVDVYHAGFLAAVSCSESEVVAFCLGLIIPGRLIMKTFPPPQLKQQCIRG